MGLLRVLRPEVTARAILGMVKETVQWAILDEPQSGAGPRHARRVDVGELAHELIQLTLRGIRNDESPPRG